LNIEHFLKKSTGKRIIIITGPTAVGKTAVAIQVAQHFQTAIIYADSRQCFKELNIGVARPSEQELAAVPHHFVASHSIHEEVTAAGFEQYALEKASGIFRNHDVAVMVGGTGLYLKAFCEGLDEIPAIDPLIRERIIKMYEEKGLSWLQAEMQIRDPGFYSTGEIQNPQRMMRALEVVESTGRSIASFHRNEKAQRDFSIIRIGLHLPREELHQRIHTRVDRMIDNGLVNEVKGLLAYQHLNALQTVGYTEIFQHLGRMITLEKAVENIKTNTRQYAKRQMTWFRKDANIAWFLPGEADKIMERIMENK
jgi:tRNA dimethylallyltransferase